MLYHSNPRCWFKNRSYLFNKSNLINFQLLDSLEDCDCYLFAWFHNNEVYNNTSLKEEEYLEFVSSSESWGKVFQTPFKYNLRHHGSKVFRDHFVKESLKEYDAPYYYKLCNKNKTPNPGRMYYSLLNYIYPRHRKPSSKEKYFWDCWRQAKNYVFRNFDQCDPIHWLDAQHHMPKNTSSGFDSLRCGYTTMQKKGDILPDISRNYLNNWRNIINKKPVEDYCMFAMRGHLSDRTAVKTRPVWLISASTCISELRFYQPFYNQINEKKFFTDRLITGKGSLPRLRQFLHSESSATMINTDISAWDSYRADWHHELIIKELGKKLNLDRNDRLEFNYCLNYAIRTPVLFPSGKASIKKAGIISGTAGTLLVNSLLNMIAGYTLLYMMKLISLEDDYDFVSKVKNPNWLGDDFAFFIYGMNSFKIKELLDKFSSMSFSYFGVIVKPEKTVVATELNDRKYLGYQLRDGFLYRSQEDLFQSLLYTERQYGLEESFLVISFSRFFSYLLLGGINNYKLMEFFYYYMGKYGDRLALFDKIFFSGMENIFKLLKDVWNVVIPSFSMSTFKQMNLELIKYCLIYGYDFKYSDLF